MATLTLKRDQFEVTFMLNDDQWSAECTADYFRYTTDNCRLEGVGDFKQVEALIENCPSRIALDGCVLTVTFFIDVIGTEYTVCLMRVPTTPIQELQLENQRLKDHIVQLQSQITAADEKPYFIVKMKWDMERLTFHADDKESLHTFLDFWQSEIEAKNFAAPADEQQQKKAAAVHPLEDVLIRAPAGQKGWFFNWFGNDDSQSLTWPEWMQKSSCVTGEMFIYHAGYGAPNGCVCNMISLEYLFNFTIRSNAPFTQTFIMRKQPLRHAFIDNDEEPEELDFYEHVVREWSDTQKIVIYTKLV